MSPPRIDEGTPPASFRNRRSAIRISMIRLQKVTRMYSRGATAIRALDEVSLEIPFGEFAAVTGPSGCGKSTLLNILGGLDQPDAGEIWVGDLPLHKARDTALTRYRRHDMGIV